MRRCQKDTWLIRPLDRILLAIPTSDLFLLVSLHLGLHVLRPSGTVHKQRSVPTFSRELLYKVQSFIILSVKNSQLSRRGLSSDI